MIYNIQNDIMEIIKYEGLPIKEKRYTTKELFCAIHDNEIIEGTKFKLNQDRNKCEYEYDNYGLWSNCEYAHVNLINYPNGTWIQLNNLLQLVPCTLEEAEQKYLEGIDVRFICNDGSAVLPVAGRLKNFSDLNVVKQKYEGSWYYETIL